MPDRLLLLHDGPSPDIVLDTLAAEAGYAVAPLEQLGSAVQDLVKDGHSCLLLDLSGAAHTELPRFLSLVLRIPEVTRPYVVALLNAEHAVRKPEIRTMGVDDVVLWPVEQEQLEERLLPARRFLRLQRAYQRQAIYDPLTGALSRVAMDDRLTLELERARRLSTPLAIGMVDLDSFKAVNDLRGHLAGDAVLAAVVSRMRSQLRPYDALGRFGGDEFLLILIGCGLVQAQEVCQRIRSAVEGGPVEFRGGSATITISIGLTVFEPPALMTAEDLLLRADRLLMHAKRTGKNAVVVAPV